MDGWEARRGGSSALYFIKRYLWDITHSMRYLVAGRAGNTESVSPVRNGGGGFKYYPCLLVAAFLSLLIDDF